MRLALLLLALGGPGVELGLGPLVLTGFRRGDDLLPLEPLGWLLLAAGVALLIAAFRQFAVEGGPQRVVRGGVYRVLAHPMYVGSTLGLVGEALILRRAILLAAAGAYAVAMAALVRMREAPRLSR